jgi:hypothetical protein
MWITTLSKNVFPVQTVKVCETHVEDGSAVLTVTTESKYLRQRRGKQEEIDQLNLAEEGRAHEATALSSPALEPLSPTRFYVLIGLIATIILTFSLFGFAAHHTGKGRMKCTEGLIFSGALLISCFTVLAMIVARRNPQEALLAGLFEFLVGFALVVKIHDFM